MTWAAVACFALLALVAISVVWERHDHYAVLRDLGLPRWLAGAIAVGAFLALLVAAWRLS